MSDKATFEEQSELRVALHELDGAVGSFAHAMHRAHLRILANLREDWPWWHWYRIYWTLAGHLRYWWFIRKNPEMRIPHG